MSAELVADLSTVDWRTALAVQLGLALLLFGWWLLCRTHFVANCRTVVRVLRFAWTQRQQLFGTAMMLSNALVHQGMADKPLGQPLPEGLPPTAPAAAGGAKPRGKRRTMRSPPLL